MVSNENSIAVNTNNSPKSPNSNSNDSTSSPSVTANQQQTPITPPVVNSGGGVKRKEAAARNETKLDRLRYSKTDDPVRIKCRELLTQALELSEVIEEGAALHACDELAAQIEDAVFEEFKNTEMKYKNRVRSRIANLKDAKNPKLRQDGFKIKKKIN